MGKSDEEVAFEAALAALKQTSTAVRDGRRKRIVHEIAELERELQLLDSLPSSDEEEAGEGKSPDPQPSRAGSVPNKPQGMLRVMSEAPNRTWKLSDVRDVMVDRGWLQPGEKGTHQLQNVAFKLKTRKDVTNPRQGRYRITSKGMAAIE